MKGRLPVGCCAGVADLLALDATPDLDFIELPVASALIGSSAEFEQLAAVMDRSRVSARAANVFLPSTLKVVGPEATNA